MHVPSTIANSTTGDDGDLSVNGIKPRRNLEVFGNRITFVALTSNDDSSSSLTDPIFVSSFDSSFVACAICACSSSSGGVSSY